MSREDGPLEVVWSILALIQGFLVLFAASFFAAALIDAEPMLPETYGKATEYPATWWAGWFLLGHGIGAVGLWSGFRRLAVAGVSLVTPAYFLLAVFAIPASFGSVITLHSALVGAPMQIMTVVVILVFNGRRE